MSATLKASLKAGSVAIALAFAGSHAHASDSASASFERMLAHEPAAVVAQAAPVGPADPLVAAMVVPLRDGVASASPAQAAGSDPVAASFARMLTHQPNATPPALPADAGTDPLIAAVVRPLLRAARTHVAGVAPPMHH